MNDTAELKAESPGQSTVRWKEDDLGLLQSIDSRLYGQLKLNQPEHSEIKKVITTGIFTLEQVLLHLIHKTGQVVVVDVVNDDEPYNDGAHIHLSYTEMCNVYCKLGHYNLLIEEYSKALSAYQKYYRLYEDYWKNSAFMYGLGLVYFHFKAHHWAIKLFEDILYLDPSFTKSKEIQLRLGMMFKDLKIYPLSQKHYNMALADDSACSLSKAEISFQVAHLFELQSQFSEARKAYEELLRRDDLNETTKAAVCQQLGWMLHTIDKSRHTNTQ